MAILDFIIDVLLKPFQNISPVYGLIYISIILSAVIILLFKYVSKQEELNQIKKQIIASLYEAFIERYRIKNFFRALFKTAVLNLKYLKNMIIPIIFLSIVVIPVLLGLDRRFAYKPFNKNDKIVIAVNKNYNKLSADKGIIIETGNIYDKDENLVYYRLKGTSGKHNIMIGDNAEKLIINIDKTGIIKKYYNNSATIFYPKADMKIFSILLPWYIYFFIFILIFSYGFSKIFKIVI